MAEYIEREAAIKRFNFAVLDCLGMEPTIRAGDIIKALESIPAADVRPVVRNEKKILDVTCPLVLVPPHGRLIDADAFLALVNDSTILPDFLKCIISPLIRGEPTVIEAEEGEA